MILKHHLPFHRILLQASIPFLLYSLICCIEITLRYESCPLLQESKNFLLGIYLNYPLFILAMLTLNGLIGAVRRAGMSKEAEPIHKRKKFIPQIIKSCLCFTLIYACFQLINSSLPQKELSENLSLNTINGLKHVPRILDEGEVNESYFTREHSLSKEEESKMELFEVGKIVGSRPIPESAMAISKDGKTVFLIEENRGVLRIVDISENENPKMLSTLSLNRILSIARALLLSGDEKLLYTSTGGLLEIIDISNLKSPVLLSSIQDNDMMTLRHRTNLGYFLSLQTSMALSWKEKALYVGGPNVFQIFSVENPKQPQLIFTSAKNEKKETLFATSVATSADGKTLYYANGTIEVYNISLNPEKPVLQSTFKGTSSINSLMLGKDNKTLYAAGRDGIIITLEKIAIEENSPFLKTLETFNLGVSSASPPSIAEKSLSENTLFLFTTQNVKSSLSSVFRAYNLVNREVLSHSKDLFPNTTGTLLAIPNTKNFVISKDEQLSIVSFFSNYPNPHSFSLSNNTIGAYNLGGGTRVATFMGIDRLYTITISSSKYYFNIVEMSNTNEPETVASFPLEFEVQSLEVVESVNRAFVGSKNKVIQVLDFSDFSKIQSLGSSTLDFNKFYPMDDGKTVLTSSLTINSYGATTYLKMLDFSDLSAIKVIAEEKIDKPSEISMVQVSSQGIIFFCLKTEVLIYNLSESSDSRRIGSIAFPSAAQDLVKCSLFEEKEAFFLETHNSDTMHYLSIFNISDIKSPKMLTIFSLPKFTKPSGNIPSKISSDALKLYCWDLQHILVIDLSDLKSPVIVGQIRVTSDSNSDYLRFSLSGDDKFGYLESLGKMTMVDLRMKYSLFLGNNNFALGKKSNEDLMLLQLTKKSHFGHFAQSNYKIIKLSLSKISLTEGSYEDQTSLTALPDWITFDKENLQINIESKKERDVGNYTLHSACSLKVPFEAFDFVGNRSQVEDLVASLVSMGFLDNQRFLTQSFRNEEDFLVYSQYSVNKSAIYKALKKFYFETFTPFRLEQSLDLRVGSESLFIETPSLDVIKVDIRLKYNLMENEKENSQFLSRPYGSIVPLITEHKTHLRIEGPLDDVNAALKNLVINNKTLFCDGEIIITDNLNQPLVKSVKNIMRYFTSNKPPRVNLNLQEQIDMVPIYTGEFVTIALNHSTFIDDNVENLNYHLVMNTAEKHEKPNWVAFSNDLVMKITAPEQILNREIKLLMIAENEFEKVEVPFTLEIKLSPVYLLKVLILLSPYILTVIGLYIKANKIYNIVFRKWYKHPKEFFVEVGREIGPEVIPPVWFIAGETKEAKIIVQELYKKVARDLGCSSSNKEKIIDYFWDFRSGGELDAEKLNVTIEEAVAEIDDKKRKQLKLYLCEGKSRKSLINKMVENQLVLWKLDLKQEKRTRDIYNKMKDSWIELVKWDNVKNQFAIKQERFDEIFESFGSKVQESKGESIYLSQVTHESHF